MIFTFIREAVSGANRIVYCLSLLDQYADNETGEVVASHGDCVLWCDVCPVRSLNAVRGYSVS